MTTETKLETVTTETKQQEKQQSSQEEIRTLQYFETILCATLIGIVGGLVASVYYFVLEGFLHGVWDVLPEFLEPYFPSWLPSWHYLWIATTMGGLFVGLSLYWMGQPGEMALVVDKVHDPGRIEMSQTPPMIISSLISITSGGSAGPEAPLVQINGSFGSWLGDRLKLSTASVRVLTFCGMSAALGAFFGAPIGGALFALEIPHRRGLEYYEALVPAILSGIFSFAVFKVNTGLTIGGIYHFDTQPQLAPVHLVEGVVLGAMGAIAAIMFIYLFRFTKQLLEPLEEHIVLMATLGGLAIGLIALVFPQTLFFSETQIETVIETGPQLSAMMLFGIAIAKMFAISFTLHCGFRGGFIFPLFFIGTNLGLGLSMVFPFIHPTIAMLCLMAAVNVAVTKTPISTSIILTVLSDTTMISVIAIASFVSFFLTSNIGLLKTQRSRILPIAQLRRFQTMAVGEKSP